jgi:hypothetical protein
MTSSPARSRCELRSKSNATTASAGRWILTRIEFRSGQKSEKSRLMAENGAKLFDRLSHSVMSLALLSNIDPSGHANGLPGHPTFVQLCLAFPRQHEDRLTNSKRRSTCNIARTLLVKWEAHHEAPQTICSCCSERIPHYSVHAGPDHGRLFRLSSVARRSCPAKPRRHR